MRGRPSKILHWGLGPFIMRHISEGWTTREIADKIDRKQGITLHHASISRFVTSEHRKMRAEMGEAAWTAYKAQVNERRRERKAKQRKADKRERQANYENVINISLKSEAACDRLRANDNRPEDDDTRLSGIIAWSTQVARAGMHKMALPRWVIEQMLSELTEEDRKAGKTPKTAIEHGLYLRGSLPPGGDPDQVFEIGQIFRPDKRIQAARVAVQAITNKQKLHEGPLKGVRGRMDMETEVRSEDGRLKAKIRAQLEGATPAVLAMMAMDKMPSERFQQLDPDEQLNKIMRVQRKMIGDAGGNGDGQGDDEQPDEDAVEATG